jgi:SAM-dependent methyltransferase
MFRRRRLVVNAITFVPGVAKLPLVKRFMERRVLGTGGSDSARYCYSVWLRHLVSAAASGLNTYPGTVAELGPGDSLGMGLAALLSGAGRYYAFDVVPHANALRNQAVFEELIELFRSRAPIPDEAEFPQASPKLRDYAFPAAILTPERMQRSLASARLDEIRASMRNCTAGDSLIQYRAPWYSDQVLEPGSVDMIFSQAVLEHVDLLFEVYRCMCQWLAPGGFISHQIDLQCHGWAEEWNGHWTYSDLMWKLIRGKDSWLINREPASVHLAQMQNAGFRILRVGRDHRDSRITRTDLARRFRDMTDEDLRTSGVFVQAARV